jgi:hypothetical protein
MRWKSTKLEHVIGTETNTKFVIHQWERENGEGKLKKQTKPTKIQVNNQNDIQNPNWVDAWTTDEWARGGTGTERERKGRQQLSNTTAQQRKSSGKQR